MAKICGVYKIVNKIDGKIYVGSSQDINRRCYEHKRDLNNQIHCNSYLQRAWNKYGEQNFRFEIIEECLPENQFKREQYYLDVLCPFNNSGYNIVRQISADYITTNYMTKICCRCKKNYDTLSHLSKYCDDCKDKIKQENFKIYLEEQKWYGAALECEETIYVPYGDAEYFWECNC